MKILAISDLHGEMERLDKLADVIKDEKPDLALFAGDIVKGKKRGDEWLAAKSEQRAADRKLPGLEEEIESDVKMLKAFLDKFAEWELPLAYVPGNMDSPKEHFLFGALNAEIAHPNIRCVHGGPWLFKERYLIYGFGGDISEDVYEDIFQFMSPRWEVEYQLKFTKEFDQQMFFLFHLPPRVLVEGEPAVGNEVVHEMIKTYRPALVVVGHQHDLQKQVQIGPSLVVSPGALKKGKFALIDWPGKHVEFASLL